MLDDWLGTLPLPLCISSTKTHTDGVRVLVMWMAGVKEDGLYGVSRFIFPTHIQTCQELVKGHREVRNCCIPPLQYMGEFSYPVSSRHVTGIFPVHVYKQKTPPGIFRDKKDCGN